MDIKPTSDQLAAPVPQHTETVQQPTGAGKFGQFLGTAVNVAGQLASTVAGAQTMGMGPIAGNILGGLNGGAAAGAGGLAGADTGGQNFEQLLLLQEKIQNESAQFNAQTNISKTEHETRMSAIRNIRAG